MFRIHTCTERLCNLYNKHWFIIHFSRHFIDTLKNGLLIENPQELNSEQCSSIIFPFLILFSQLYSLGSCLNSLVITCHRVLSMFPFLYFLKTPSSCLFSSSKA